MQPAPNMHTIDVEGMRDDRSVQALRLALDADHDLAITSIRVGRVSIRGGSAACGRACAAIAAAGFTVRYVIGSFVTSALPEPEPSPAALHA